MYSEVVLVVDKDMVHQELNMIQNCITRMAEDSFQLRKWYVSMVFIGGGFCYQQDINIEPFISILFVMTLIFWYLDTFFLRLERLYRRKYAWVIKKRITGNTVLFYNLDPYEKRMWLSDDEYTGPSTNYWRCFLSKTLLPLYSPVVVFSTIYFYLLGKWPFCS